MNNFIQNLILASCISVCFLFPKKAFNAPILGVDMSYQCTATPNVYFVTVKIYRDCSGAQLCANCPTSLSPSCMISLSIIGIANPCSGTNFGVQSLGIAVAQSAFDVVQLCSIQKTVCTNCGTRTPGTFAPGVEVYTFKGNISLAALAISSPNCCQVRLAYSGGVRNANITTVSNPAIVNFYSDIIINRCAAPCNSSPVFNNPVDFVICNGIDQTINVAGVDPDGDSLSYALAPALTSYGNTVPYISPYGATTPFPYLGIPLQSPPAVLPTGMRVNKVTGDIQFRPTTTFIAPLAIEVKQWNKVSGVTTLLGTSRRDFTIYSQNCPANSAVTLKKYDSTGVLLGSFGYPGDTVRICPGARFCRIYVATDATISDTTDISWSTHLNMPGATFTALYNTATRKANGPRQDSFKFCWTAPITAGSLTPYVFTVTGKDRFCSLPAKVLRSVSVYVSVLPEATINKTILSKNSVRFKYIKTNSSPNTTSLTQWKIESIAGSGIYNTFNSDSIYSYTFPASGNYKIKLMLNNPSCGITTIEDSISIRFVILSMVTKTNIGCKGDSSGSAVFTSTGGVGTIQYQLNSGAFQNNSTFSNLLAGNYLVTVMDSFNTIDTLSFTITEPANSFGLSSTSHTNIKCKGDSSAQVTLAVNYGTPPFLYKIAGSGFQSNAVFINLKAGNYIFSALDSHNCAASTSVIITEPNYKLIGSLQLSNAACYGSYGSAILYASGGNTPYQYRMDAGSYNLQNTFYNLVPKAYTFTIKDWNACELTFTGTITEPSQMFVNESKKDVTCYGFADGNVTITASGAIPPYQYKMGTGPWLTTNVFANLTAGNYNFTSKDSTGCMVTSNIAIGQPALLTKVFHYSNASCLGANNGTASITVTGGILPYAYNWNTIPVQTTSSLSNLAPGFIKVIVSDSNLCSISDSATIGSKSLFNNEQICAVTVDTFSGKNTVIWNKTSGVGIASYKIYASTNSAGPFSLVDSQSYNSYSSFTDNVSTPLKQSYFYQLKVIDSCGNESAASNTHRTIYATATAIKANRNAIYWNVYSGASSASGYNILRSANKGPFINIKQLPLSATSFTDSLAPNGTMRYLIELVFSATCNPTSNKAGAIHVYSNLMDMGVVGISEAENKRNSFEVYPNPTDGSIKINAIRPGINIESVEVINLLGSTVITQIVGGLNHETTINMNELADGVYNLLIKSTTGVRYPVKVILNRGR
ncbi:MAG: T9SS type A sorting domain-containing protein [Bacteroidota bacterium]|nr:T9SS type A sorting domain-containing protein [Bacteroidota bacterium]